MAVGVGNDGDTRGAIGAWVGMVKFGICGGMFVYRDDGCVYDACNDDGNECEGGGGTTDTEPGARRKIRGATFGSGCCIFFFRQMYIFTNLFYTTIDNRRGRTSFRSRISPPRSRIGSWRQHL